MTDVPGLEYPISLAVALEQEIARLRRGLKFYADSIHFDNSGEFDDVSGDPPNFLYNEGGSTIEDGTVAKRFLEGWDFDPDDDERMKPPGAMKDSEA